MQSRVGKVATSACALELRRVGLGPVVLETAGSQPRLASQELVQRRNITTAVRTTEG